VPANSQTGTPAPAQADTPAALYDEAANYVTRKIDEYRRNRVPFSRELYQEIMREQQAVATRNAARLATRTNLAGTDFYYLGMLQSMSEQAEEAMVALRRFLAATPLPTGEMAQNARRVIAIRAAQRGQTEEAERAAADYARNEPQNISERAMIETLVAIAFLNRSQTSKALPHAREAFRLVSEPSFQSSVQGSERDQAILTVAATLARAYEAANNASEATATMTEVRRLGMSLPSANLYSQATELMQRMGRRVEPIRIGASARPNAP
jgi:tetratricopeptide (TPR) repeat protein